MIVLPPAAEPYLCTVLVVVTLLLFDDVVRLSISLFLVSSDALVVSALLLFLLLDFKLINERIPEIFCLFFSRLLKFYSLN